VRNPQSLIVWVGVSWDLPPMPESHEPLRAIRAALAQHQPRLVPPERRKIEAAVAVVLRAGPDGPQVLIVQRAVNTRDPWSGHMSFPGGRVQPGDADSLRAAVRETCEEVGLGLDRDGELLGRLSDIVPRGRGRRLGVVAAPHVFAVRADSALTLDPAEVSEVVWLPLAVLEDRRNRSGMWWRRGPVPVRVPCYRYQGHLVWGMTLRALDELVELARAALDLRLRGTLPCTR
jgi:8-oxo-dGTP pyrophosphatase MutT (NUDIX family)